MEFTVKDAFLKLFIQGGYVLDFTNKTFDEFTTESIGESLCEKYGLSKGKSLSKYCSEAPDRKIYKLFKDLLLHYEIYCTNEKYYNLELFTKCKEFIKNKCAIGIIDSPTIYRIDQEYIKDIYSRSIKDVENTDFDSAITKSRTLLEETFCYLIQSKGINPSNKGNAYELYNQVKELYNMQQNPEIDKRINMLLQGLEKILKAIVEMRNVASDSHGLGNKRINIKEHHARLFVNSATTMAEFILAVKEYNN